MSPRRAREILKAWVRGVARAQDPSTPEIAPCPLTAEQRLALYQLLTQKTDGPREPPPLNPGWLPPA